MKERIKYWWILFQSRRKSIGNWIYFKGRYFHYTDGYLNGKKLSLKERYEYEHAFFDFLFK